MVMWSGRPDGGRSPGDGIDADVVIVRVVGAAHDDGADDVWSAVEGALELAEGRAVVVDLRWLRDFEPDTVESFVLIARTSRRRHDDVRLIVRPGTAIERQLRRRGVFEMVTVAHGLRAVLRPDSHGPGPVRSASRLPA